MDAFSSSASNILSSGQGCLFVFDIEINTPETDDWQPKILLSNLNSLFAFDVEINTSESDDWQSITINMKYLKDFVAWTGQPICLWCWNQDFWSGRLTFHDNLSGCHQFQTFCCLIWEASMSLMSKSTLLNQMIDNPLQSIWMLPVHQRQTFCCLTRAFSLSLIFLSTQIKTHSIHSLHTYTIGLYNPSVRMTT